MGAEVCNRPANTVDREQDPEVIARRTELFNKYVSPYFNMIYKLCIRYSFASDHVEENYTEVLLNFYRYIETYDPDRPLITWLHIVTKRHVYAMEKRRLAHSNKDFDNDIEDYAEELFAPEPSRVSHNCLGVDNWRELYNEDIVELLDQLKPCYRDALILQESGYSLKEIAEIEFHKGTLPSLNVETIKSRLRFARQFLMTRITKDGQRLRR